MYSCIWYGWWKSSDVNLILSFYKCDLFLLGSFLEFALCFPSGSGSTCNAGDLGLIPGLERSPAGGHGNLLQYSCLENPHGQRSLVGYSSWGCKESDTTEWLSTHTWKYEGTIKILSRKTWKIPTRDTEVTLLQQLWRDFQWKVFIFFVSWDYG